MNYFDNKPQSNIQIYSAGGNTYNLRSVTGYSKMEDEENNDCIVEEETSDSSSSDGEEIVDIIDKDFFKTLSCLKNKDPRIYDENIQFFSKPDETVTKLSKTVDVEKPVFVKDYVIGSIKEDSSEDESKLVKLSYTAEQEATKQFFRNQLANDSSSDDDNGDGLMKIKVKTVKDKEEEDADYIQFLKGNKTELGNKEEEKELKPLHEYWNCKGLDENEAFLKDYILNRRYLGTESEDTPNREDLSEDERELEEQAEFESHYNKRFETEENLLIKRFPRKVEGSLRRKDDTRKRKRAETTQRKVEEKAKKQQEIKKQQKEKLIEIEERLRQLKELTGNKELGFKDEEILEDFDSEKHDKKMNEFFNEDFYNQEESEHPGFGEDDYNWDYDDINMDCEENIDREENKKVTRSKKKKLKKKKAYADIMDIAKPSFNPEVHKSFKEYFDEYYSLDCEDFIDDLPCRFKYREVVPNDYGLTIEEILMADDSELNQWASIKKICKRRPEHVEKNEVKIYSKKAKDAHLKRKILHSLYVEKRDDQDDGKNLLDSENVSDNNIIKNIKNKSKHISVTQEGKSEKGDINLYESDRYSDVHNSKPCNKNKNRKLNCDTGNFTELNDKSSNLEKVIESEKKYKGNEIKEDAVENGVDLESSTILLKNNKNTFEEQCKFDKSSLLKKTHGKLRIKEITKELNISNSSIEDNEAVLIGNYNNDSFSESKGINKNAVIIENNLHHQPKNKKKKRKFGQLVDLDKSSVKDNLTAPFHNKDNPNNLNKIRKRPFQKRGRRDTVFKRKKIGDVTTLSDNRLRAYGIKPKQFRAKMKYSKSSRAS